jgi:hypothetical protein
MDTEVRRRPVARLLRVLVVPTIWLERARGWKRLALIGLYGLILIAAWAAYVRLTALNGLPDIGDPFDVAVFRSAHVPDAENAVAYYRRATGLYKPLSQPAQGRTNLFAFPTWAKADDQIKGWVESNREALELFREGSERDRADFTPASEAIAGQLSVLDLCQAMTRLALLETSRLEEAGDAEGAWAWYRVLLRASRHCLWSTNAAVHQSERTFAVVWSRALKWSANPRVDAKMLRKALADVVACETLTPPNSHALKVEYLDLMRILDDPELVRQMDDPQNNDPIWEYSTSYRALRRFFRHEPERTRRLVRLIAANWLAFCDEPPERRPPIISSTPYLDLFEVPPDGPASARVLPPQELARWFDSLSLSVVDSSMLKETMAVRDRDRLMRGTTIFNMAKQLYQREHGAPPPSPEALVGQYLERLPEDYVDLDGATSVEETGKDIPKSE